MREASFRCAGVISGPGARRISTTAARFVQVGAVPPGPGSVHKAGSAAPAKAHEGIPSITPLHRVRTAGAGVHRVPTGETGRPPPPGAATPRTSRVPTAPVAAATYWLTHAFLARHLLTRRAAEPARLPVGEWERAEPREEGGRDSHSRGRLARRLQGANAAAGRVVNEARQALAPAAGPAVPRSVEIGLVAALTAVAAFLRAWDLPGSPDGIHGDETELAMEALRSIQGENLGIWTGVTLGHPAGYAHWMALIFRIGGADVTTMRLASAIPGIAIVPVGYLLVRALFPFRVAILSAAMTAVSVWFVIQSRIAFGGITAVFMALLAMWLIVAAVQSRRTWVAVAAGIALGLGLYTFKTFLVYFAGIWGVVALSMLMDRDLRRAPQPWVCLAVSLAVGAPMLLFYATSGYVGQNLNDLYQVSLSSASTWLQVPGNAVDAVLLVHLPIEGNSTDAPPSIAILPVVAALLFWAGLAVCFLRINDRRTRLLLAAWLIGMTPMLLVPGAESRRYLLGIFFVLVIASIGVDAVVSLAIPRLRRELEVRRPGALRISGLGTMTGAALAVAFLVLFAVPNLGEVSRWGNSDSVRWFFNYEYNRALVFVKESETGHPVRFYSSRQPFENSLRRFVLPGTRGIDGAEEYERDGGLPGPSEITEDTVFLLLDEFIPLAGALEAQYQGEDRLKNSASCPGAPQSGRICTSPTSAIRRQGIELCKEGLSGAPHENREIAGPAIRDKAGKLPWTGIIIT